MHIGFGGTCMICCPGCVDRLSYVSADEYELESDVRPRRLQHRYISVSQDTKSRIDRTTHLPIYERQEELDCRAVQGRG